jgi:hypothetical protein
LRRIGCFNHKIRETKENIYKLKTNFGDLENREIIYYSQESSKVIGQWKIRYQVTEELQMVDYNMQRIWYLGFSLPTQTTLTNGIDILKEEFYIINNSKTLISSVLP